MKHAKALVRGISDLSAKKQREMIAEFKTARRIRDVAVYEHSEFGAEAREALMAAVDKADVVLLPRIDVFGRAPGEASGKLGPGRELMVAMPKLVARCRRVIDLQTGITSDDEPWWDLVAAASERVKNARKISSKRGKQMAQRRIEMRPYSVVSRWEPGGERHCDFARQQVIWKSRKKYRSWHAARHAMDPELRKVGRGTLYKLFGERS